MSETDTRARARVREALGALEAFIGTCVSCDPPHQMLIRIARAPDTDAGRDGEGKI